MALNFQQVFDKIREIGAGARIRQENLESLRGKSRSLLDTWADKNAELRSKVERARQADQSLRCALPLDERLDTHREPGAADLSQVTLIAADGSQIVPDRHAAVLFGLINVGAIVISYGSEDAPRVVTDSDLSFDDEVASWSEGLVALKRDLAERRKLLAISKEYPAPLVTLTDGPLQLWESRESNEVLGYEKALQDYLDVLSQLQERQAITAGYVDKPSSNLLVRLLEVAEAPESEIKNLHELHPLLGVTDLWLLNGLLQTGERSAVFSLQARSNNVYKGALALHFFYVNVGRPGRPWSVRVEIPAWVSRNEAEVNLLHAALLEQCSVMGADPFPYILHRAHEAAVVTLQEKQEIEQMLALTLRKTGGEVGEPSAKQAAKDSSNAGRKRYP
jgi:hypothetical protein